MTPLGSGAVPKPCWMPWTPWAWASASCRVASFAAGVSAETTGGASSVRPVSAVASGWMGGGFAAVVVPRVPGEAGRMMIRTSPRPDRALRAVSSRASSPIEPSAAPASRTEDAWSVEASCSPAPGASTVVSTSEAPMGDVLPPRPAASERSPGGAMLPASVPSVRARASASRAAVSASCSADPKGSTAVRAAARRRSSSSCAASVGACAAPSASASAVCGSGVGPPAPASASRAPGSDSSPTSGGCAGQWSKRWKRGPPAIRHAGSLTRRPRSRVVSRSTCPETPGPGPFSEARREASSRAGLEDAGPRGTTPGLRGRGDEDEGVRPDVFRVAALMDALVPCSRMRTVPPHHQ
ncbi:hypothetical protein COSO111634_30945 [Corallococcus soli]